MSSLLCCTRVLACCRSRRQASGVGYATRTRQWLLVVILCCSAATMRLADCGSAAAAMIHSGNHFDLELTAKGNVGLTPLKAFELTVVGKAGAVPNAFDSTKGGFPGLFPGITTSGSALHQVWEFGGVVMTPTLDLAGDPMPFPEPLDSHFLVDASPDGDVHPFNPPDEDAILGSPEDPRAGFGSYLRGTFFLRAGYNSSAWDLAYLVVPAETQLRFDFELAGMLGEFDEVMTSYDVLLGDMNVDGDVDFDDIAPFILALQDPLQYAATYGIEPVVFGDMDNDRLVDFDDIPLFIDALTVTQSSPPLPIPELPSGHLVLSAAILVCLARHQRGGLPASGNRATRHISPATIASAKSNVVGGSGTS